MRVWVVPIPRSRSLRIEMRPACKMIQSQALARDPDRERVVLAGGDGVVIDPGGPGAGMTGAVSAKLQTASRSCLLTAQRNVTASCLSGRNLTGAARSGIW